MPADRSASTASTIAPAVANGVFRPLSELGKGNPCPQSVINEAIALNAAAVEPALKRAYSYSRTAYEAAATSGDEMKKVLEANTAQLNKAAISALEEALKYAPAGSESVVGNLKTAIAAAQSAYDNMTAINKQLYDTVEQNVATVQAAAGKTTRRAKK